MSNYEKILYKKVFNFQDICEITGNENTAKSLIRAELQKKHIKKVQHNLYVMCDLETQLPLENPYLLGSKISKNSFISYRSALDYYAQLEEKFHIIYVSDKTKFQEFEFNNYTYKFVNNKTFGIVNINGIKITDKEKTFVDCINKPELAGGGEHLVTTLELIGKLDGTKILKYLTYYNSKKLYAKVGFMLEWLNYVFDVPKKVIDECYTKCGNVKYYFEKNQKGRLIKKWNLIISEEILARGEEQYW